MAMGGQKRPLDLAGLAIPTHVAIIMDGSGRWAKQHGLPRQAGHEAGVDNLRDVIDACIEFGIKILTIYAFSSENWEQPETEVHGLMRTFLGVLDQALPELDAQGVRLHHSGDLSGIDPRLQEKLLHAVEITKDNDRLILNVASNYGGRAEILYAVAAYVGR